MTDTFFETPNLIARQFTATDDAFIFELLNTPSWKQFIGDRSIHTATDAANYISNVLVTGYQKNGYGAWLILLKETGQPIGMCGLFKRDFLDKPDLGFAFLPGFEGQGFAYESSMAALAYGKQTYNIKSLYATTTPSNLRSQRLLERCGFIRQGTVKPPDDEMLLLYHLNLQ